MIFVYYSSCTIRVNIVKSSLNMMFKYSGLSEGQCRILFKLSIQANMFVNERKQLHDWINTPTEEEPQTDGSVFFL